jgi:hypothetical protein
MRRDVNDPAAMPINDREIKSLFVLVSLMGKHFLDAVSPRMDARVAKLAYLF